jgi:hypothetical protein
MKLVFPIMPRASFILELRKHFPIAILEFSTISAWNLFLK